MKKVVFAVLFALALPSCASLKHVQPFLNDAQAAVGDTAAVIETIRSVVSIFFLAHPSPQAQIQVETKLATVALSFSAATRILRGASSATNEDMDKAWTDFRGAYAELVSVMKDLGIVPADGKFATSKGATITIPEPLALQRPKS